MLTVDFRRRGRRALAAARDRQRSGAFDEALGLLARAQAGPLDAMEDAEADVLRARIAAATRGSDAPALLLAAARRVEPLDIALARHVYLDALAAALFAGRLAGAADVHQVATAARAAAPAEPPRAEDLLLDGLASLIVEGSAVGTPLLREAIGAFGSAQIDTDEVRRWLWLAGRTAAFIWDYESWDSLTRRQIRSARADGALAELPLALSTRVGVHIFAGEMPLAASLVAELDELAEATDARIVPIYGALSLAAFSGRDQELAGLLATSRKDLHHPRRGHGHDAVVLGFGGAAQRPGAIRRGVPRRGEGHRERARAVLLHVRDGRADRGREPDRPPERGRDGDRRAQGIRRAQAAPRGHQASKRGRGRSWHPTMPRSRSTVRRSNALSPPA